MNGSAARFVSFSVSTARSRGAYEGGLHGESVVGCELFVGIQLASESLEIRVQSFTAFFKFAYGEDGGLEGVIEGVGLHGEMDLGMRPQGIVRFDLTFNGSSESLSQFFTQIIGGSNVSALLQDGFIPLSVHDISSVSSCPCGSKVKVQERSSCHPSTNHHTVKGGVKYPFVIVVIIKGILVSASKSVLWQKDINAVKIL